MKQFFLFLNLLFPVCIAAAQPGPPIPTDSTVRVVKTPAGYVTQLNAVYTQVNGWDGRVDLYTNPSAGAPTPVVLSIHGGAWNHGTKESQSGFSAFFKRGYAVANVEYRLTPQATAPAAVEDVRCALIYLVNNAKKLNIDPSRIVVMGSSAGGHLALMAGLLENDHTFDSNCSTKEKIKVAAIIDNYGIADPVDWMTGRLASKSAARWLGEGARDGKFTRSVSPIHQVKKTSPPTFIVHGDADPTVPFEQSVTLYMKLREMNVKSQFLAVPGGLHGRFTPEKRKEISEATQKFLIGVGL